MLDRMDALHTNSSQKVGNKHRNIPTG